MADLLRQIEEEHKKSDTPDFQPGDTVRVAVRGQFPIIAG